MSTNRLMPSPRPRRGRSWILRASASALIVLLIAPAPAHAQTLPSLGSLLGAILEPILNPLLGLLPGATVPNEDKLDAQLKLWTRTGTGAAPRQRVIVTVAPGQLGLVGGLLSLVGGLLQATLPGVNALVADVTQGALGSLLLNPGVIAVSLDGPLLALDGNLVASTGPALPPSPVDGTGDTTPALRATLGLPVTSGPAGNNVGIAIIDSGIAPSPDFLLRVSAFYDFTDGGRSKAPIDPYGHGSHIAGIIGSNGGTSAGAIYRGIGANARLIGLRVLDANGNGQTSNVIKAIEFATQKKALLGIDIINLSLGHPIYESADTDPLVRAVERAVDAGIVVVVSAGNFGFNSTTGVSGYAGITSPGNAPSAITVGALNAAATIGRGDDAVAAYSSRGPTWYDGIAKPDVLAPGQGIISNGAASSTLYASYPSVRAGSSHMRLNGTSMATAAASGVVALIIESHRSTHLLGPSLTPNTIKALLQYTATPLAASGAPDGLVPDALAQGAGAVNALGAIALARNIDASRPIGADWLSGTYTPVSSYANVANPWAQTVTWGATRLAGDLLNRRRTGWERSADWGLANVTWDSDVTPETNVVWDGAINWAANIVWGAQLVGKVDATDGTTFVWGYVENPATTGWGNLATAPTDGQTFVWGYTDVPPVP
jgi:serine protease AprX